MEDLHFNKDFILITDSYVKDSPFVDNANKFNDLSVIAGTLIKNYNNCSFELCRILYELKNIFGEYTTFQVYDGRYINFYTYCDIKFGLLKTTVYSNIKVFEKFFDRSDVGTYYLRKDFEGFNLSQLKELLTVSDSQLLKDLESHRFSSCYSTRQLREYVKSLKNNKVADKVLEDNAEEEKLDELESSFDIQKEYTFDYFKERSKNQLIDIAFKCYQKYKELQKSGVKVTKTKKAVTTNE